MRKHLSSSRSILIFLLDLFTHSFKPADYVSPVVSLTREQYILSTAWPTVPPGTQMTART